MTTVDIKFRGLDDWSRPVYWVVGKQVYIGSVITLFGSDTTKEEVDAYFKENLDELIIFGSTFNCEPLGSNLKKDIKLNII